MKSLTLTALAAEVSDFTRAMEAITRIIQPREA